MGEKQQNFNEHFNWSSTFATVCALKKDILISILTWWTDR